MKKTKRNKQAIIDAYKKEKNVHVYKRLQIVKRIFVDGKSIAEATKEMNMSESWGSKWYKRFTDEGLDGLKTRPRSGRPSRVPRWLMRRVMRCARKISRCWTAEEMKSRIFEMTNTTFELSYVRKIMKKWGYTMKTPVRRHVKRASNRRIRWFQKKMQKWISKLEAEGYTICVQDETIAIADSRARKEVYTQRGTRAVYIYSGDHHKTIVYGVLTINGKGYFERHDKFDKDTFEAFLKNAHLKFGKLLMILDRAPQHRANVVLNAIKELDGQVRLAYLPPGCPDLSAIEELWRQMKMAVLSGPYVKLSKMCSDIDQWLEHYLPTLNIYNYLYRHI